MPIDLVIDERDGGKPPELGGSTNGDGGTRSNADSTSHTDGASTPDVVSFIKHIITFRKQNFFFVTMSVIKNLLSLFYSHISNNYIIVYVGFMYKYVGYSKTPLFPT